MSTIISKEDIEKVAKLSYLGLTADEIQAATKDVGDILTHFSAIQHIDTKNVPPAEAIGDNKNISRPDTAAGLFCAPANIMEHVPETHNGHIKVSAVFE